MVTGTKQEFTNWYLIEMAKKWGRDGMSNWEATNKSSKSSTGGGDVENNEARFKEGENSVTENLVDFCQHFLDTGDLLPEVNRTIVCLI